MADNFVYHQICTYNFDSLLHKVFNFVLKLMLVLYFAYLTVKIFVECIDEEPV